MTQAPKVLTLYSMLSCSQGAGHHGMESGEDFSLSFQIKSSFLSTPLVPFGQLRLHMGSRTHHAPPSSLKVHIWSPMVSFPKSRPYGFAGGPGIKTLHFHCSGLRFDPWLGKFCMLLGAAKTKQTLEILPSEKL